MCGTLLFLVTLVTTYSNGALIYSGGHIQPVFISTWGDDGYNRANFQLSAGTNPVKTALDGVLCENGPF